MAKAMAMKIRQREKENEIKRLMKVYQCTRAEAESLYDYDTNYCESDEDAQDFLINEVPCTEISEKEVMDSFYKMPTQVSIKRSASAAKSMVKQVKEDQKSRMSILVSDLTKYYGFLFPNVVSQSETEATFTDGVTEFSLKLSKHKVQKVVTKQIKRKGVKLDANKNPLPMAPTEIELRSMAIENVMRAHLEDFPALSTAGTQFGYVTGSGTFPFGSVKLTHHKK